MPDRGRAIGDYDVDARWVEPLTDQDRETIPEVPEGWKTKHMLRSRYFVMIRKCNDSSCCKPKRSPLRNILPTGFLPSPRVYEHNTEGRLVL